jgi:hypothetical protein
MPRVRQEVDSGLELTPFSVEEAKKDSSLLFRAGLLLIEMLGDVYSARGNYHVIGADKLHRKYLITSNVSESKFYAGGFTVLGLLQELSEEYNLSDQDVLDALRTLQKRLIA